MQHPCPPHGETGGPGTRHPLTLTFADLLDTLGHHPDEHISICRQAPGGPFTATVVPVRTARHTPLDPGCNMWFGVNPVTPTTTGRGTTSDVTRLTALYADLDVKDNGLRSFDVAHTVVAVLSDILGTRPSAVTLSGNGLQPYWPVEDHITGSDAAALLRRFGRLTRHLAALHDGRVDPVYDLTRVLRVPGSTNLKGHPKPVLTLTDSGHPLTTTDADEALRAYGVLQTPEDTEQPGDVVSPPGEWAWAPRTCGYVTTMIRAWEDTTPPARHPWLVSQFTRLACAHRLGCITRDDHQDATRRLTGRFRTLLTTGSPRREQPGEVADAAAWGARRTAGKDETGARTELGAHTHAAETTPTTGPGDTLLRSEDGHAGQLITAYQDMIRYNPERGLWLAWDGTRWAWQPKGGGTVREYAKNVARKLPHDDGPSLAHKKRCLSSAGITGALKQAETDPRVTVAVRDLDADPYLLNTPAGLVDLRTGDTRQPTPATLVTKTTTVAPATTPDPVWEEFLDVTFSQNPDLRGYVQRLVGITLIGAVHEQVLAFLHGKGANGKSTLTETLMHTLGTGETGYAVAAAAEMLMIRNHPEHPAELAQLAGARMVVCSELDDGQRFAEARIKQLTGGDSVNARFLYGQPFTFTPTHTVWLLGNHHPQARVGGEAFWRRVKLVEFTHVVPEQAQDPTLKDKLRVAGGTVLAWAVQGAVDYLRDGMGEPPSVARATRAYAADQDTVGRFVDDRVHVCAGREPVAAVRAAYEGWCREAGEEPVSARRLTQELTDRWGVTSGKGRGGRRVYTGVMLLAVGGEEDTSPDAGPGGRR